MKRMLSKFVGMGVFVSVVLNTGVGVVDAIYGGSNESVGNYELKMEVSSLKEKNKNLEERIEKMEKEQKQAKEELDNHKKNDFHGYGFKNGGWWKNSASLLIGHLMFLPISAVFACAISVLGIGLVAR